MAGRGFLLDRGQGKGGVRPVEGLPRWGAGWQAVPPEAGLCTIDVHGLHGAAESAAGWRLLGGPLVSQAEPQRAPA